MFARTPRLTLRPGWPEDAAALAAAINHREVAGMLARVPWPYSHADADWWLSQDHARPDLSLLILEHRGDRAEVVGGVGLHAHGSCAQELGYWLTPAAWGRGLATEAAGAAVNMARHALGLDRLIGRHRLDNPASGRVLEKLGFRRTGSCDLPCLATGEAAVPSAAYVLDLAERPALAEAA